MSSVPFHVLMLLGSDPPGSSSHGKEDDSSKKEEDDDQRQQQQETTKSSPRPPPEEVIPEEDYLLSRHRHRMSKVQESSSDGDGGGDAAAGAAAGSAAKDGKDSKKDAATSAGKDDKDEGEAAAASAQSVPVCTPIEIAIINCCDCGRRDRLSHDKVIGGGKNNDAGITSDTDGSSSPMEEDGSDGSSGVERPAKETNGGAHVKHLLLINDDKGGADRGGCGGDHISSSTMNGEHTNISSSSGGGNSCASRSNKNTNTNTTNGETAQKIPIVGSLARGKEGEFAALIAQHCHTVSDRALAIAVLERTMEHDKRVEVESGESNSTGAIGCNGDAAATTSSSTNRQKQENGDSKSSFSAAGEKSASASTTNKDCSRMANFLSAGGLKVLSQWLVDSFTPIDPPMPPQSAGKKGGSKRKRQESQPESKGEPETSPTGPIILPLLSILQSIPFRTDLVIESRINKQVRKLRKNLEKVIGEDKKNKTEKKLRSMEDDFSHPASGGMPIVEVYTRLDNLMETWRVAIVEEKKKRDASSDKGSANPPADFYRDLKAKMTKRLETLSSYEAGEAPKPTWLMELEPKDPGEKVKAVGSEEVSRQRRMKEKAAASAAAAKKKADEEKRQLEAKRRNIQIQEELNAEKAAIEENKKKLEQFKKRLQEENDKRKGNDTKPEKATTRRSRKVTWADQHSENDTKLAEVKVFVRDTEEDARRGVDNLERNDEAPEEVEYDTYDYDEETQASDSVESDDFDDDPNLSQEEEAGFT